MANEDEYDDANFGDLASAVDNPALAEAAARIASEGPEEPAPTITAPTDGPVILPGGFRRVREGSTFGLDEVTTAWVTELNGEHEEYIHKAKMHGDDFEFTNAILTMGVTRLGDSAPTKDDLDGLIIGDREFLLLEISRATYGNDIEYDDEPCPHCGELMSFVVHKDEDIPINRLDSPEDAEFEVPLRGDRIASVRLPTGEEQRALALVGSGAEANTLLIASCVSQIRGGDKGVTEINGDKDQAKRLGLVDRQALIKAMGDRMTGPRYNEVKFTHPECGNEVSVEVALPHLFRGL